MSDETTLQLHWAAQAAAGVGRTLLPKQPDFSQESFTWSDSLGALMQGAANGRRAGLRFRDLSLILAAEDDSIVETFPMQGRSIDEGFAFFERIFGTTLSRPEGLPAPPANFIASHDALAACERRYATANAILTGVRAGRSGWSPVRCWPHHFDIAILLTLSGSGEDAHTIGAGMAPADGTSAEPYYYITPWPYPPKDALTPLRFGRWNTEGWVGAILPADNDPATIQGFIDEVMRTLIEP